MPAMASVIECTNLSIMRASVARATGTVEGLAQGAALQPARWRFPDPHQGVAWNPKPIGMGSAPGAWRSPEAEPLVGVPMQFSPIVCRLIGHEEPTMRGERYAGCRAINSAAGATEDATTIRRAVLACAAGQAFEIFDFVIYGFFAVAIGRAFFPSTDPAASLLASFATFAVGFLFRPVGAIVIGCYGDRYGRRKALVVTVGMMAVRHRHHRTDSVLCVDRTLGTDPAGDLPHVPGLLHRWRMGRCGGVPGRACADRTSWPDRQFPAGGDRDRRDGRDVLGRNPEFITESDSFFAWGWRVPFLIGFVLGPIGYYLRTRVAETPAFQRAVATQTITRMPIGRGDPTRMAACSSRRSGCPSSAASSTTCSWCSCRASRRRR